MPCDNLRLARLSLPCGLVNLAFQPSAAAPEHCTCLVAIHSFSLPRFKCRLACWRHRRRPFSLVFIVNCRPCLTSLRCISLGSSLTLPCLSLLGFSFVSALFSLNLLNLLPCPAFLVSRPYLWHQPCITLSSSCQRNLRFQPCLFSLPSALALSLGLLALSFHSRALAFQPWPSLPCPTFTISLLFRFRFRLALFCRRFVRVSLSTWRHTSLACNLDSISFRPAFRFRIFIKPWHSRAPTLKPFSLATFTPALAFDLGPCRRQ